MTKLNQADVIAMREAYADGATQLSLAAKYGLRQTAVSKVVCGLVHRDAGGPITNTGRASGERHGKSKLTSAQVDDLRFMHSLGYTNNELGERFGISTSQVRLIANGTARANG